MSMYKKVGKTAMNKEWEFILNALGNYMQYDIGLSEYEFESMNMVKISDFIKRNRLEGYFYQIFSVTGCYSYIPRNMWREILDVHECNVKHNRDMLYVLSDLSKALEAETTEYAFVKGAYLISFEYESGIRISNDIDILIPEHNLKTIDQVLTEMGFVQKIYKNGIFAEATRVEKIFSMKNNNEIIPYYKAYELPCIKNACVDLLVSTNELDKSACVENSYIQTNMNAYRESSFLRCLETTYNFAYLCLQIYNDSKSYLYVRNGADSLLYRYCDVNLMVKKYANPMFWNKLNAIGRTWGIERPLYYVLSNTYDLFSRTYSQEIKHQIKEFLNNLQIKSTDFLSQVKDSRKNKLYCYDMSFVDWVFKEDQSVKLVEIPMSQCKI